MRIGLVIRAYSTTGLAEQVRNDRTISAELVHAKGKVVIAAKEDFGDDLRRAAKARQTLLDRYGSGQVLNADREVSVMESEDEGYVPLFEYTCRQQARGRVSGNQIVNATHSGMSSYAD